MQTGGDQGIVFNARGGKKRKGQEERTMGTRAKGEVRGKKRTGARDNGLPEILLGHRGVERREGDA